MTTNSTDSWQLQPQNLFRLYSPELAEGAGVRGNLFLEVDRTGAPSRCFRFTTQGEEIITVTLPAASISSLPGCAAFHLTFQFKPEEIQFRDNTFSTEWTDISDLVQKGRAEATIDEADHVDEFLELQQKARDADPLKGGVIRWTINVTPAETLELCLQSLPVALGAISGRPSFARDTCPGYVAARHPISTNFTSGGPLRGPRPVLFTPSPEITRAAIAEDDIHLKTGKIKN